MLTVIKLIVLLIGFSSATKEGTTPIKYEVYDYDFCPDNMDRCRSEFTQEVIINKEDVDMIHVVNELPILRKGMLQITANTKLFYIGNANLTEIEPGAFDGQNITEVISITGNELTIIRSGTFRNLRILSLDLFNNKIAHIEDEAISDMPNLTSVYLSENDIVHISVNSFVNLPQFSIFDFTSNKVTKFDEKCFDFMSKNQEVYILGNDNRITEIHPEAIDGIVNCRVLSLNNNTLTHVPDALWTTRIKLLSLANNQVEELPESFYSSDLTNVNLVGNPLNCKVQEKLKEFMKDAKSVVAYEFDANC